MTLYIVLSLNIIVLDVVFFNSAKTLTINYYCAQVTLDIHKILPNKNNRLKNLRRLF